jgi:hypothetical protein
MSATLAPYARYRIDAYGPAMDLADSTRLPQTVFYHPDHAWTCAVFGAKILRDRKSEQYITWLPQNYFDNITEIAS